jgi:hypothetical protein
MPKSLAGVAFLHNATAFGGAGLRSVTEDQHGRMYSSPSSDIATTLLPEPGPPVTTTA